MLEGFVEDLRLDLSTNFVEEVHCLVISKISSSGANEISKTNIYRISIDSDDIIFVTLECLVLVSVDVLLGPLNDELTRDGDTLSDLHREVPKVFIAQCSIQRI